MPHIERDQNWYLHKINIYIYSGEAFVQMFDWIHEVPIVFNSRRHHKLPPNKTGYPKNRKNTKNKD